MDSKRRDFLKIAGLTAIAGIAAPSAFNTLLKGEAIASAGQAAAGGHGAAAPTGKRYGMVIDVKKFTENPGLAEQCVSVCHTIHNVPDFGNRKDEIKWIWIESYEHTFPTESQYKRPDALKDMPILTLCNHCDNPPCVRACPTKATYKKKDGIVGMDYHRCIGCRFCMAACPYGARSFNWRDPRGKDANGQPFIKAENPKYPTRMRGVVEKCNFCTERLAIGQIPACVEVAAQTKAIVFGDMNDPESEISQVLKTSFTIQRNPAIGTHPSLFYII
ncbi:MAG: sulfate reduction electron transfer complex DsrMKJOP subunit DsrO [Desulfurivibrionaceae bacterium]|jgi:molybdopterin-containing oxidoreductase family iron-sulfur binding subunit|nr:4Fe-4S dicluster domain-containing protein [Pseudomonadota bacterium]MCG2822112.1 4Fe-4S dicluster domain-containing protein [Desulfobulbaceae bacterium]MDP2001378.1 4Fe-4S dicluster domain-containing protein [Desulfurivibrionaceae bacterium]MBU4229147.1 4Fe-4S dicluster domain-containing protein [Pseudomonadota bacterium]MBU4407138.1 4Fe-4S dicluster domain-containing protein [Pseudomonadota bacterium]